MLVRRCGEQIWSTREPSITVFFGSDAGAAALRAGTHVCVRFDPHHVLRPLLQPLQHVAGDISRDVLDFVTLLVLARHRLIGQRVPDDVAVPAGGGRSRPTHLDAGGAETDQVHFLWGGGWGWKGVQDT